MNICISCCIVSSEFVRKGGGGHKCNEKLTKRRRRKKKKKERLSIELCNLYEPFPSLSYLMLGKQHDRQNGAKANCPSHGVTYDYRNT